MNIIVIASPGYSPHERPHSFIVDEDHYDIAAIEVRILEPDAEYFWVRTTDDLGGHPKAATGEFDW